MLLGAEMQRPAKASGETKPVQTLKDLASDARGPVILTAAAVDQR